MLTDFFLNLAERLGIKFTNNSLAVGVVINVSGSDV